MTTTFSPFKGDKITFAGYLAFVLVRPPNWPKQPANECFRHVWTLSINCLYFCGEGGERTVKLQLDKPAGLRGLPPNTRFAFKIRTNNYYRFSIAPNSGYLPCEVKGMYCPGVINNCSFWDEHANLLCSFYQAESSQSQEEVSFRFHKFTVILASS